jgi:hypothetical protein
MSTMNPLPPQAYTKETLVQAYAWLQSQSENIKELATTPDVLVSLFLKAKMQGTHALERPSIQNFKNELKNLAGMIGEFEVVQPTEEASSTIRVRSHSLKHSERVQQQQQLAAASTQSSSTASVSSEASMNPLALDSRSLDLIQEVKIQFNLSCDIEALRLLIAVGYSHVKGLLK